MAKIGTPEPGDQGSPATRLIPWLDGETVEIDTYQEMHRPQNQQLVGDGYPLNPTLRQWFDNTPNEHREPLEVKDWWGLPFIVSDTWEEREKHFRSFKLAIAKSAMSSWCPTRSLKLTSLSRKQDG